jgi:hypothetical protein
MSCRMSCATLKVYGLRSPGTRAVAELALFFASSHAGSPLSRKPGQPIKSAGIGERRWPICVRLIADLLNPAGSRVSEHRYAAIALGARDGLAENFVERDHPEVPATSVSISPDDRRTTSEGMSCRRISGNQGRNNALRPYTQRVDQGRLGDAG